LDKTGVDLRQISWDKDEEMIHLEKEFKLEHGSVRFHAGNGGQNPSNDRV
jgi:hypothetical protein